MAKACTLSASSRTKKMFSPVSMRSGRIRLRSSRSNSRLSPRCRKPQIRVLASRPLRVRESGWGTELFGDYDPEKVLVRIWMRTAVRKKVTSFGTFLSTLCHEFCHHLDYGRFGFQDSPHTRGFYERAADLYHHARGNATEAALLGAVAG